MMRKFGRDMADMAGRAMKGRTDDKMGRAMMAPPRPVRGGVATYKKGGETKSMMKKEVAFMKKKGAPKSMIKHEMKEAGMKKGVKKMSAGGSFRSAADGVATKGKTKGKMIAMRMGGMCK
jgi:hypothetical protein